MSRAFVVMTAMPPTTGHADLIGFASHVGTEGCTVIVCTQPGEPYTSTRYLSLIQHYKDDWRVTVENFHREIEQDPTAPGFWDMWREILASYGLREGDFIVASETYGARLAQETGTKFIPYDIGRELNPTKATLVRACSRDQYGNVLPEFRRKVLRKRVTFFGAESVGKTTVSRVAAGWLGGAWLFEYARPYLEQVGPEVTHEKMLDIWLGQRALQKASYRIDKPFIVQDTDLFSTVGYWKMWSPGTMPPQLETDALVHQSDLYIILSQNIPFEEDPLRYGGDKRESTDQYWIDLCEHYYLNYAVVDGGGGKQARISNSLCLMEDLFETSAEPLRSFQRECNG